MLCKVTFSLCQTDVVRVITFSYRLGVLPPLLVIGMITNASDAYLCGLCNMSENKCNIKS